MTDEPPGDDRAEGRAANDSLTGTLREVAVRVEAARRLAPPSGAAVLRSIVEATVVLFDAEAASLALHDPATDRLVFRVAAGEHGEGVVGLQIEPGQGVAGYVFATGQPLAVADVARDARFGRATAEQTGYVPRSLVAVPLLDEEGVLGVLEVLDRRGGGSFDLRDIELASVFARQATVAIRSSRIERDTGAILESVLGAVASAGADGGTTAIAEVLDRSIAAAIREIAGVDDDPLWLLADQIARLRAADPAELGLVRELLEVVAGRAERGRAGRAR